ncbi:Solute carrier family 15 member 1 [Frankliniella fusca]|uniref:Solute carrier family 15 member 1 n=1 Tax=Frankliniella fusca TaxID=407009 RepID=A0AAE1I421_9NEOP|nr:Solute carrier family 15 member 1 [Frankliniella fusca]
MSARFAKEGNGHQASPGHPNEDTPPAKSGPMPQLVGLEAALEAAADDVGQKKKLRYPKAVFPIIVNEFCERFSFYGLRGKSLPCRAQRYRWARLGPTRAQHLICRCAAAVLVLFLKDKLGLTEDNSTVVFHSFNMVCYLFPIFGGIVSDSYLGKFRTILILSLVYAVGNVLLSLASWRALGLPGLETTCAGLLLIGVGTGGIKPCVSSFGGDQFVLPQQQRRLEQFFSIFYFVINAGGGLGMLLAPMMRVQSCLGEDTCYPLSFGTPALLMVLFCVVFVSCRRLYVMKNPEGNVLVRVARCLAGAAWRRLRHGPRPGDEHWLDSAAPRWGRALVDDVKVLLSLLVMALPLPVFWALFDMQGSRWTFQARQLDGRVGGWTVQPDQIGLSGSLLVLILLPMFEAWLHPWLARCGLLVTPLQRMSVGGLMASAAFVCAAVLEIQVQQHGVGQLHIFWQLPQYLFIALADIWFAIAVLEFGFKEAPVSMKSSITALFLLTTAIGDILVIIITSSEIFSDRVTEFFTYAGLMAAVMCVFMLLAVRYQYVGQPNRPVKVKDAGGEKDAAIKVETDARNTQRKR